jgi:hypothetical protein
MVRVASCPLLLVMLLSATAVAQSPFSALLADKPAPDGQKQLMVFGRFVGAWTFKGIEYHDDGTHATDEGEIQFHWILGGRAIQDVWIETARSDQRPKIYGTTVRIYDPDARIWHAIWVDPVFDTVQALTGGKAGNKIVLQGRKKGGVPIRWIFSHIKQDSFYWYGEKQTGKDWRKYEELWARRKQ